MSLQGEGSLNVSRRVKIKERARRPDELDVSEEFRAIGEYLAGENDGIVIAGTVIDRRGIEQSDAIVLERLVLCIAPVTPIVIPDETQVEAGVGPLNEFMTRVQDNIRWNTGIVLERVDAKVLPDESMQAPMLILRKASPPIIDFEDLKRRGPEATEKSLVREVRVAVFPNADFATLFKKLYEDRRPTDTIPPEFFVPVRK